MAALLGIGVVYLGTWIAVQFYWLRKGLTPGLPGLVFVFSHLVAYLLPFLAANLLGPVGLLGVFLYALQSPTPSTAADKPFDDHPLELALAQSSPVQDRNDSSFEAWTRPCPKCGRSGVRPPGCAPGAKPESVKLPRFDVLDSPKEEITDH